MSPKKADSKRAAFKIKLDKIIDNLLRETGINNKSQLGKWLMKKDDRNSEMYFTQARYCGYLNYEAVVNRCIEEGIDLNEVFGAGPGKSYNALLHKYEALEKEVKRLAAKNEAFAEESRKINAEFRAISKQSHEITLKYLELANKGKG